MKKYYQVITTCDECCDEWIEYATYDKAEAIEWTEHCNARHCDKHFKTECREFELPDGVLFEDLTDDEQCDVLSAWNVIA